MSRNLNRLSQRGIPHSTVTKHGVTDGFTMAELVQRSGVSAATIRYYMLEGLLPAPVRVSSNRFLYDERHVEAISLVRLLRERRHLTLDAIRGLFAELLPDLLGMPDGGVFRPDMWQLVLGFDATGNEQLNPGGRLQVAGLTAFCLHGYSEVTVDDVCRAANVAKGTFYNYFSSKEELFFACAAEVGNKIAVHFATQAVDHGAWQVSSLEGYRLDHEPLSWASEVLVEGLQPYLPVVLDLGSLAVRRGGEYSNALVTLLERVKSAVAQHLGDGSGHLEPGLADRLFEHVLGVALRASTGFSESSPGVVDGPVQI